MFCHVIPSDRVLVPNTSNELDWFRAGINASQAKGYVPAVHQ